jgi:phospholipid transport system transporter-binding protein
MTPLPAALTFAQAPQVLAGLQAALAQAPAGAGFALDAAAMQEFDTSAIAVLLQLRREARARGLAFTVHRAPAKLRQLAALYGVEELLELAPAAAAAGA